MKKILDLSEFKPEPAEIKDREGNVFIISPHFTRKILKIQSDMAKIIPEKDGEKVYEKSEELIKEVLYLHSDNGKDKVSEFVNNLDITETNLVAQAISEYMLDVMTGEKKKNSETSSQPSPTSTEPLPSEKQ